MFAGVGNFWRGQHQYNCAPVESSDNTEVILKKKKKIKLDSAWKLLKCSQLQDPALPLLKSIVKLLCVAVGGSVNVLLCVYRAKDELYKWPRCIKSVRVSFLGWDSVQKLKFVFLKKQTSKTKTNPKNLIRQ